MGGAFLSTEGGGVDRERGEKQKRKNPSWQGPSLNGQDRKEEG